MKKKSDRHALQFFSLQFTHCHLYIIRPAKCLIVFARNSLSIMFLCNLKSNFVYFFVSYQKLLRKSKWTWLIYVHLIYIYVWSCIFFQVRITHWYVKRYCTEKYVSKFVFYFPYILLIVPLTLVLVDRIFIK